jgi:hypothetical protein
VLNNSSYRASTGISDSRIVGRELRELVDRGVIEQSGTRGTTTYRLRTARRDTTPRIWKFISATLSAPPVPG